MDLSCLSPCLCSPETPWPFKVMTHAVGGCRDPSFRTSGSSQGKLSSSEPWLPSLASRRFLTSHPTGLGARLPLAPPSPALASLQNSWEREGTPAAVSKILIGVGSGAGNTEPGCRAEDHLHPACHHQAGRTTLCPALVWKHRASLSAWRASDPGWGSVLWSPSRPAEECCLSGTDRLALNVSPSFWGLSGDTCLR